MKKIIALALVSCLTITLAKSVDQKLGINPTATQTIQNALNVRYVDPYKIIPDLVQWNDKRMEIQKDLESRNSQIEELKMSYTKKATELQSMGNLAKDSAKENLMKELKRLETNIQIEQQAFQEYAERSSQEAQMAIFKEIEQVAREYAQENNVDFIFAGGAIYVNEKYDISAIIAERMNKRYAAQKKQPSSKK